MTSPSELIVGPKRGTASDPTDVVKSNPPPWNLLRGRRHFPFAVPFLMLNLTLCLLGAAQESTPPTSVLTNLNNNARTGNYIETSLNPTTVNAGTLRTFGRLYKWDLEGQPYAQPLYVHGLRLPDGTVHNVAFAATEENWVYAFDVERFAQLWGVQVNDPVRTSEVQFNHINMSPWVGITSTPVISLERNAIYVVAKTKEAGQYLYKLHALDLGTGHERPGSPIIIKGSAAGSGGASKDGVIQFDAKIQLNRPGLLLSRKTIYIAFGGHADNGDYHGWVFGYDADTLAQVGAFNTTPTGAEGGIWQAGRGLVADPLGNIFFMTGNGQVASDKSGFRTDFGQSFVRLDAGLHPIDWWTVKHHACYSTWSIDLDIGASGPLLLLSHSGDAEKNTIIGGGKDGHFYLLKSMSLGHDNPPLQDFIATEQPHFPGLYCQTGVIPPDYASHIHGGPVLWDQSNYGGPSFIYNMGEGQPLKAFRIVTNKDGSRIADPTWPFAISKFQSPGLLNLVGRPPCPPRFFASPCAPSMPGGILSLSHLDQPNSGLVWALHPLKEDGNEAIVEGRLSVFDATPTPCEGEGCTPNVSDLPLLWHSQMDARDGVGLYAKFTPVTIADGKVLVPSFGDPNTCGPYPEKDADINCHHPSWLLLYGLINPPRALWEWLDLSYVAQGAQKGVPDAASDLSGYAFEADGTQHIFYRSGNNRLNELYKDNQGWHWVDLSYVAQGAPNGVPDAAGNPFAYVFSNQRTQHVIYRGTNNRLNELYKDNQGWHWVDLSYVAQGAPKGVPDAASDLSGYAFEADGTQHIFYRSSNNRLNELYKDNHGWHWVDLSYVAQGAPKGVPDAAGNPFAYVFNSQRTQHVIYRGTNNRLNELYKDNHGWHWVDLSYVAQGAPKGVPDAASDLSGYAFDADGTQHIFYRSGNDRLNELYWDKGVWHWVDLSYVAQGAPKGPPDAAGNIFGFAFQSDGTQHVFYRGVNNRLNELHKDSQGWHWLDLSFVATGAPNGVNSVPDAAGDLSGYVFIAQKTQHVVYRSTNNRINELLWP